MDRVIIQGNMQCIVEFYLDSPVKMLACFSKCPSRVDQGVSVNNKIFCNERKSGHLRKYASQAFLN